MNAGRSSVHAVFVFCEEEGFADFGRFEVPKAV
jgi:hypothetical protein